MKISLCVYYNFNNNIYKELNVGKQREVKIMDKSAVIYGRTLREEIAVIKLGINSIQEDKSFYIFEELEIYLRNKYYSFTSTKVFISENYLQKCMYDKIELSGLEGMLRYADRQLEKVENEEESILSFQMYIDGDGNAEFTFGRPTMIVNFEKRTAQINAANTLEDMKKVIAFLEKDFAKVSEWEKQGICEMDVVAKTKDMLKEVKEKLINLQAEKEYNKKGKINRLKSI